MNDPIHITSPFQPTPSSSPLPSSSNKIDAASGFTFNPPNLSISESGTAPNLPNTTDLTSSSGSVATPNVESNSKIVIDSNSNSSDSSEANLNSSSSSVNSIQSEATSKLSTSTNGTNKSGEGETTPSASATSTAASAASAASAAAAAAAEGTRRQSTRKKADTVPLYVYSSDSIRFSFLILFVGPLPQDNHNVLKRLNTTKFQVTWTNFLPDSSACTRMAQTLVLPQTQK